MNEYDLNKVQSIIDYLVANVEYVEDSDILPEEVAEYKYRIILQNI